MTISKLEKYSAFLKKVQAGDEYSQNLLDRMLRKLKKSSNYEVVVRKVYGNKLIINLHTIFSHSALLEYDLDTTMEILINVDIKQKINLLRTSSTIFKNIYDFLKEPNTALIFKLDEFSFLNKSKKQLIKKLELFNLLRNFSSGHINRDLLLKSTQWESQILRTDTDLSTHVFYLNKSILECIINSYSNKYNTSKFSKEIDLLVDMSEIFNFWLSSANMAKDFLIKLRQACIKVIPLYTQDELIKLAFYAAETDFNLV